MFLTLLLLLAAGFFGGFIGAQVGAGAIIILPVLLFLGLPLPVAVATTAPAGWLMNAVPSIRYWRSKKTSLGFVLPISIVAAIGAVLGAKLLFVVDVGLLAKLFAAIFCGLGVMLLFKPESQTVPASRLTRKNLWLALPLAFVLGLYGGILAAGLTTIALLVFNLVLRQPHLEAVANSVLFAAILLSTSVVVFVLGHQINYAFAAPLALGSIAGSYIGAKTILRQGTAYFKWLLVAVIVGVVVKLVV